MPVAVDRGNQAAAVLALLVWARRRLPTLRMQPVEEFGFVLAAAEAAARPFPDLQQT